MISTRFIHCIEVCFKISENFGVFLFLLLISIFFLHCGQIVLSILLFHEHLLRFVSWPGMWLVFVKFPCVFENSEGSLRV